MAKCIRFKRIPSLLAVIILVWIIAACLLIGGPLSAGEKSGSHEGIVAKAGDGKLIMSDVSGKNERTHAVAATAKITLDGAPCKLEDLRKGVEVGVTMDRLG